MLTHSPIYLMDIWNRIKPEHLRNLPHLFMVYDEEKIEWVGIYRRSWYHLYHAKWSTNADLFWKPGRTETQNSSMQHFWFIYSFKKHFLPVIYQNQRSPSHTQNSGGDELCYLSAGYCPKNFIFWHLILRRAIWVSSIIPLHRRRSQGSKIAL